MKRIMFAILVTVFVLGASVPVSASAKCIGNICGGNGARSYVYEVTCDPLTSFEIGIHVTEGLSDFIQPDGWTHQIIGGNVYKDDPFTPHGIVSPWAGTYCPAFLRWTGPVEYDTAIFGFNSPCLPHDVGWSIDRLGGPDGALWSAAVGMGEGPVHSPIPEPGSLLALGSGLIAAAGMFLRRRT